MEELLLLQLCVSSWIRKPPDLCNEEGEVGTEPRSQIQNSEYFVEDGRPMLGNQVVHGSFEDTNWKEGNYFL